MTKILSFLILFLSFGVEAASQNYNHIYMTWLRSPQTRSILTFTSKTLFNAPILELTSEADEVQKISPQNNHKIEDTYFYQYTLNHLTPGTTYQFRWHPDETQKIFIFKTAPKGLDYKLLLGGDSRSYPKTRRKINRYIKKLISEDPEIVALVHGGDFIGSGNNWRQWRSWLNDLMLMYPGNRIIPIVPTRGNHEKRSTYFNEIFGIRGDANLLKNFYVSQFHQLRMINLNTDYSAAGEQKLWLESKLKEFQNKNLFVIPNYHRPAFPAVKSPSKARQFWVPLFEKYGVRLVVESDGHTLKRTAPILNNKINLKKGITYIGEGGLGVKLRTPRASRWYLTSPGYAYARYHVFKLSPKAKQLDIKVLVPDEGEFDNFIINYEENS